MLLLLWNSVGVGTTPPEPIVVQGATPRYYQAPYIIDDTDEDFLLVWFTFMARYYGENNAK